MPSAPLILKAQLHGERQDSLFIKHEGVHVFLKASPGAREHQLNGAGGAPASRVTGGVLPSWRSTARTKL